MPEVLFRAHKSALLPALNAVIPVKGALGFFDWRPRVITDAAPGPAKPHPQGALFDV